MFEGFVSQLLAGYLGRYVKNIQKEQLKIGLWNEEVLLENVELNLEAFDYLQLPFALKQGRVGRLSIKFPWKKLGWEPVIIVLEDVFVCACQRDEYEWNTDLVEKREFAGKRAKLAAAELAKLSRRVCDNQAGQSFISYITAKILDGIQVSIRNVHIIYANPQIDSAQFVLGIKFSSLAVMKQNPVSSSSAKLRGGQVSKIVEISGLGIYCNTCQGPLHWIDSADRGGSKLFHTYGSDVDDYIVAPFDVAVSLVVTKSDKLENGAPQYTVTSELTSLVLLMNDIQLQQILILWEYLCTCKLKEKYGRYCPSGYSLSRKPKGWQKLWWRYALESILSDVNIKLRKTSWKYLGWRMSYRRKYVKLYKSKLDFLRQKQPVSEDLLQELENMERESDIDDILGYRSIAERELQEFLPISSSPSAGINSGNNALERQQSDDPTSSRSRGWLNWLYLGMAGAGETVDSSQFSGVVSDEVIKDIYEATEFHPVPSSDAGVSSKYRILSSIKFNVHQITATIGSKTYNRELACVVFDEVAIECKLWEESWTIHAMVRSLEMMNPCATKKKIVLSGKAFRDEKLMNNEQPCVILQVDKSTGSRDTELSVKVVLQPFQVTYDPEFVSGLLDFHQILGSFSSQHERVLMALNGFENVYSRLLSKAEYVLSKRTKISWNVSLSNITVTFPLKEDPCSYFMVIGVGDLKFRSRVAYDSFASGREHLLGDFFSDFSCSNTSSDVASMQLQDLYDHFEIFITDFEVNMAIPECPQRISLVEKLSASITMASCIIDESILAQLEVHIDASSIIVHFSSSIYGAIVDLIEYFDIPQSKSETVILGCPKDSNTFRCSITGNVGTVSVHADLGSDAGSSLALIFVLGDIESRYSLQETIEEYWVYVKTLKVNTDTLIDGISTHTLVSSRSMLSPKPAQQHGIAVTAGIEDCDERSASADGCFVMHCQAQRNVDIICRKFMIWLNEIELHIYPNIIGLINQLLDRISHYDHSSSTSSGKSPGLTKEGNRSPVIHSFEPQRFGFSNFFQAGSTAASIPMNCFPFITIHKSASLCNLEDSLVHDNPDWRSTFTVRDMKSLKSPKLSAWKRSKMLNVAAVKFASCNNPSAPESCKGSAFNLFDLSASGIRAHFHDSSCIVGTLTLPMSKSLLLFHGTDFLELLWSVEGLMLSSSWSNKDLSEILWSSTVPNLSPVLNIHVGKHNDAMVNPQIEISFSIQHVSCILSSEFLAILIGYFSLPDWTCKEKEQCGTGKSEDKDLEKSQSDIIYKVEILDSILILPLEGKDYGCLELKIPEMYCNVTLCCKSKDSLKGISSECVVEAHKIADLVRVINVFGRDLSLSLVLLKKEQQSSSILDDGISRGTISLVAELDADLWVRVPLQSQSSPGKAAPSCIMLKVGKGQIIMEDDFYLCGLDAILNVATSLSSVGTESDGFRSDVLQFLQWKRSLKEGSPAVSDMPCGSLTETRFCFNKLTLKLCRSRERYSISSDVVAVAHIQLKLSALFKDEIPTCLDMDVSSLVLHSFRTSSMLLHYSHGDSISSAFEIHFSKSNQGENKLVLCLPSVDIWLHMSDWSEVLDLVGSYAQQLQQTPLTITSSEISALGSAEVARDLSLSVSQTVFGSPNASCNCISESTVDLVVKIEDIGVSLHIPILEKEDSCDMGKKAAVQQDLPQTFSSETERHMLEGEHKKYIAVTVRSRNCELIINGPHVQLKSHIDKITVMLETVEERKVISWPFFQLNHFNLVTEICNKQKEVIHTTVEVQTESIEVWLSYQIFYFWHDIVFKAPEAASSQSSSSYLSLKVHINKASLLLTDGRWTCNGPLMEILLKNLLVDVNILEGTVDVSVEGDLILNYNNIQKVMWEPFIEPWSFQLNMIRKYGQSALLNTSVVTNINLKSIDSLNLNFTEPLIEVIVRGNELIKDAWDQFAVNDIYERNRFRGSHTVENASTGRYAPYVLQNDTSLPIVFHVYQGHVNTDDFNILEVREGNSVQPGCSIPIYVDETPEEQIFRYWPSQSSDRLNEKKSNGVAHHMISVQLDGTARPSKPLSMDLVGLSYFEVNFSKASDAFESERNENASNHDRNIDVKGKRNANCGFVVPVVFDVSIQRYRKLIRLYSTVILLNATSMALELRFDIPFGVSPKVLDPIYPGKEFPLPLHLAESGRMRWRPLGNSYLWSEAHLLSNILMPENRVGFLRSFVCYPCHPSRDPFRCCIAIEDVILPSSGASKVSSLQIKETMRNRSIHYVTLTTPLLVKNHLPCDVSVTIESGGITRTVVLSEVETASIFHIDSSQDLRIELHVHEFRPGFVKFPRSETFLTLAKLNGNKFSVCETLAMYPDSANGPIHISVDKVMDSICGARELCISVPFLLYNCTGLPLTIAESGDEMNGNVCRISSCYYLCEEDQTLPRKNGFNLFSSLEDQCLSPQNMDTVRGSSAKSHIISRRENLDVHLRRFRCRGYTSNSCAHFLGQSEDQDTSIQYLDKVVSESSQLQIAEEGRSGTHVNHDSRKVRACMYAPRSSSSATEVMVKLAMSLSESVTEHVTSSLWSSPFFLVPASGSSSVVVPRAFSSAAFIFSVTSNPVSGSYSARTRAISFQPRYVISNACSKDISYKQKGTDDVFHLGTGQHSHLHWSDRTRDLLVSLCFNEPGWLWSGSFFPDHLGDTQVKMRNYVGGALNMIRVEVQNADVSIRDKEIVGSSHGNSGTHLILLSDDNTGFMPYRIDNFSKERLRIYQQKCEAFETTVYSYTCCPYAWDEPCYPHRLTVEVPGERVLGSYSLDDVKEHIPVVLPSTSEKPGRRLFISCHAEGAVKVLSIIDSSCHHLRDLKETGFHGFKGRNKLDQKQESFIEYSDRISIHLSFVGISLIGSYPQELLYACANDTKLDILQSVDQQKFFFQVSSLQIDNQLPNTPYPVLLSFEDNRNNSPSESRNKDGFSAIKDESVVEKISERSCEPIIFLSASKWRNKEISLVSFEYISLRLGAMRIELEEEVIVGLFDFARNVISRVESNSLPHPHCTLHPLAYGTGFGKEISAPVKDYELYNIIENQLCSTNTSKFSAYCSHSPPLPSVVPIGAPWQKIYLLARRQKKIYVELLDLAPIRLTFSFSSVPWILRNGGYAPVGYLGNVSSTSFQRGLMALADVEGAPVYLKQLTILHHMASLEAFQDILTRHYIRQLLHEMYKVFGSAGLIGNPMGFARNMGLGIKEFLSVPARGILQSPGELITGMAEGTTSLLSNTVYAISNAATQFSKAAHKSIVAFTFDDQVVSKIEQQRKGLTAHSKGVLNDFLEGLTGFLQSPIRGAEKHGLPGVLSGIALGTAGLVARPVASILEVTGKTAQSIRNRSSLHHPHRYRVRFPRPLARDLPLRPYSWEEAIGTSMLMEADDVTLKDETFVMCKALKLQGNFAIITEKRILIVKCECLVGLGSPGFRGVAADPEWIIEVEMSLESVIHADRDKELINIVGSSSETRMKQHMQKRGAVKTKRLNSQNTQLALFQMSMELGSNEEAEDVLQFLLSTMEAGKTRCFHVLHRSNLRGMTPNT